MFCVPSTVGTLVGVEVSHYKHGRIYSMVPCKGLRRCSRDRVMTAQVAIPALQRNPTWKLCHTF